MTVVGISMFDLCYHVSDIPCDENWAKSSAENDSEMLLKVLEKANTGAWVKNFCHVHQVK